MIAKAPGVIMQSPMEHIQVFDAVIGKAVPLHLCPDRLVGVQLGRVRREPFHRHASSVAGQKGLGFLGSVNSPTIPYEDQGAANLTKQLTQKANQFRSLHVAFRMESNVQAKATSGRRDCDAGDGRDFFAVLPRMIEYRGASSRRPSSPHQGKHRKAALVQKDPRRFLSTGFFLSGANPFSPNELRPPRHVHRPAAAASAHSSPAIEESSRRGLDEISHGRASKSAALRVGTSKGPSGSRASWVLSRVHAPVVSFDERSTWVAGHGELSSAALVLRPAGTGLPNPARFGETPPADPRFPWDPFPVLKASPPAYGELRVLLLLHEVSCHLNRHVEQESLAIRSSIMFDRVTFDPNIMGGRACIRGMRIPVSVIVSQVAHGATFEEILEGYPDLVSPRERIIGDSGLGSGLEIGEAD